VTPARRQPITHTPRRPITHRRRRRGPGFFDGEFVAMAHRGGAMLPQNLGRENTLVAFDNAVRLGYRYLETDVCTTADGQLITFHDDRLDRVTDGSGLISERTLQQLRTCRVGGGDQIPTLDEVLDSFPTARFNIDIKTERAIAPLIDTLRLHDAESRVCVGSFGVRWLRQFRAATGGRIATSASFIGTWWSSRVPLLGGWTSPADAFQVPIRHRIGGHEMTVLTPRLIAAAHRSHQQVHVWTVNDATMMHELIDMGVDGLITDLPDVLRGVLVSRGLWSGGSDHLNE